MPTSSSLDTDQERTLCRYPSNAPSAYEKRCQSALSDDVPRLSLPGYDPDRIDGFVEILQLLPSIPCRDQSSLPAAIIGGRKAVSKDSVSTLYAYLKEPAIRLADSLHIASLELL